MRIRAEVARLGPRLLFAVHMSVGGLGACEAPPVAARAVWLDVVRHDGAARTVHFYDRGAERTIEIEGIKPDLSHIPMLLSPSGRGLLVRPAAEMAKYVDLADSRIVDIRVPDVTAAEWDRVRFTSRGDALLWFQADALRLIPVAAGLSVPLDDQGNPSGFAVAALRSPWARSAMAAPMLFVHDLGEASETRLLSAVRYPVHADDAMSIRELGRVEFAPDDPARPPKLEQRDDCEVVEACGGTWAITPSGDALVYRSRMPDNCDWWRWEPESAGVPECLGLPSEFAETPILGALDRETFVFAAPKRLVMWKGGREETSSVIVHSSARYHRAWVDSGTALVLAASSGPVILAQRSGIRHLSTTQTRCDSRGTPAVAPHGRWIAWTCLSDPREDFTQQSAVVRVSGAGLQRYEGIAMQVLAIDDDGDLLLYSTSGSQVSEDGEVVPESAPRTLYTLSGDESLYRVHYLEPTPAAVIVHDSERTRFIQAAPLG